MPASSCHIPSCTPSDSAQVATASTIRRSVRRSAPSSRSSADPSHSGVGAGKAVEAARPRPPVQRPAQDEVVVGPVDRQLDGAHSSRLTGRRSSATRSAKAAATEAVQGPGASRRRPSTRCWAWTSRVDDVRNTSSADASSAIDMRSSVTSAHSRTSSRVIPARQPDVRGGVRTTPSWTTKMFEPVPSQRSPAVLAKIASLAPLVLGPAERDHVLGVRRGLEPSDRRVLVAAPRHGDARRRWPARRRGDRRPRTPSARPGPVPNRAVRGHR